MRIAYVNYGNQSGVTPNVTDALLALGHEIVRVDPTGVLALRDPRTRRPRPTPRVLLSIAASALRFGPQAVPRRWNTVYAFDQHTKHARTLLSQVAPRPDVVLQNGALFAPGRPPPIPYVLLLDNTCLLAQRQSAIAGPTAETYRDFAKGWLDRELETYRGATGIATFSEVVRESVVADYGIDRARVHVVGAGANVVPDAGVQRQDDGRTLLFIGKGHWRRKGGPILLKAFQTLRRSRSDLRLILVGPTDPIELPPGVTNLGLLPFEEVRRLLAEATVFVLPTRFESFGIAFLDAMVSGVPCVGSQVGAVPEILEGVGVCVPPGDAQALATAIGALLDDPARRAAMAEAGKRRVLEGGYLWPEVGRKLSEILAGASSGKRAA
jgi:glycosyltransferase involved in cell wall biosynthesis